VTTDRQRLERLIGGPELDNLRRRLRRRFERSAGADTFTLSSLTAAERTALAGLLGRPARPATSMRLSITEIDGALARAGVAPDLRTALEVLDGPVRDIAAERLAHEARWDLTFEPNATGPLAALLASAGGRGLVKRTAGGDPQRAAGQLADATRVLERLPAQGVPRSRLAAELLHDAHALDDGRPVAALVLAALAHATGEARDKVERRRDAWTEVGVLVNELSKPVLALGLVPAAGGPAGRLAAAARELGEPVHLSLRALLREPTRWAVGPQPVHVCENPTVVAVAADRLGARCAPLVCTDGMPGAAQRTLLAQLAGQGAELRYHGDFDWPGLRIGNFVMRAFGARPWRFQASDYVPGEGRRLDGDVVAAEWDDALAPRMVEQGRTLEEEALVDTLVGDLGLADE
jgi:uncharacterized protein (TIGR02679 family)